MGGSFLRSLLSVPLLGIAGLAVLVPGVAPVFGSAEGAEGTVFDRPAARVATAAQAPRVTTSEDVVLANWEYTAKNPFGDAFRDVLQALDAVNHGNEDAAKALGAKTDKQALQRDEHAAKEVLRAYQQLADAAKDANSASLAADAAAMLAVYQQMQKNLGNPMAIFQNTQQAQAIANKAVTDATPFR